MNLDQRSFPLRQRSTSFMTSNTPPFNHTANFRNDYLETYKASVSSAQKPDRNNPEVSHWTKESKVIKFTGNMKENINGLVMGLECNCGAKKDFVKIICTFGDKITRLREERARHKENSINLKKHIELLQNQLDQRNKRMQQLEQNYYIQRRDSIPKLQIEQKWKEYEQTQIKYTKVLQKNQELRRQLKEVHQQCQHLNTKLLAAQKQAYNISIRLPKDQTCLLDFTNSDRLQQNSLRYSALAIKVERYENLFRQLPMDFDEIARLLQDYAKDLPCFATKQEKQLYFMATRMNANLWKKKLEMEVKDLCQRKEALRKMEQQIQKKKRQPLQPIVNGCRP